MRYSYRHDKIFHTLKKKKKRHVALKSRSMEFLQYIQIERVNKKKKTRSYKYMKYQPGVPKSPS